MIDGFKAAALDAGKRILEIYEAGFESQTKGDGTPVTVADQQAEKIILDHLQQFCPDIPVVAEEEAAAGHVPEVGDRFILVDPLDGTREFINRNGEFTVNIGLIENGLPVVGVIYAPVLGELFWGDVGKGAWQATVKDGLIDDVKELVSASAPEQIRVLASRSHRTEATNALIDRMGQTEIIAAGSSLKFCRVAQGLADFYPRLGPTMEWDTAAGQAILCAAGGQVIVEGGEPMCYGKSKDSKNKPFANPYFVAVGDEKIISHYGLRSDW